MQSVVLNKFQENGKEFDLKAKVLVVKNKYGRTQDEIIFLKPKSSAESYRFFSQYFPDLGTKFSSNGEKYVTNPDEFIEVLAYIASPINKPVRLSIIAESRIVNRPHFLLSSPGDNGSIESELARLDGSEISFTILPPEEDEDFGGI